MTAKRKILYISLFCFLIWMGGFFYYLYYINSYKINASRTDAIAIFVGGENRIDVATQLLKKLYAPVLFVTGVDSTEQLANFFKENKISEAQVIYGFGVHDIEGAAQQTANFINSNRIKSLRLVTAYYNMPASISALSSKVPYGIVIIPHPVYPSKSNYLSIFREYKEYKRYVFGNVFSAL